MASEMCNEIALDCQIYFYNIYIQK
jgi:hypothetical protein